jgi:SAM-dependent methyltransferase
VNRGGADAEVPLYDRFASAYDLMIDWDARLANEAPFFEWAFSRTEARRVVDVACGTGRHAGMFASWGLDVVGLDASEAMVQAARRLNPGLTFEVADFLSAPRVAPGPFDVAVCIGNSLPHLTSAGEVEQALRGFASMLRPGGVLVVQNRNADRMYAKGERLLGPSARTADGVEYVFVRLYDLEPDRMRLTIVTLVREAGAWRAAADSTVLTPLFAESLLPIVERAGFDDVETYGTYDRARYEPADSVDLTIVATRG